MSVALTGDGRLRRHPGHVLLSFGLAFGLIRLGIWNWASFLIVAGAYVVLWRRWPCLVYILLRRVTGLR